MQRFSTQSKLNLAHMTREHIFQATHISFSDINLEHEMFLRQKGTYAPPQDKARRLNIHNGK
jgi:metallophosphoesterase superfamily enzyme